MDDMKKSALLWAKRDILTEEEPEYEGLCYRIAGEFGTGNTAADLKELLSEFWKLFDGTYWHSLEECDYDIHRGDFWWKPAWKEPRVRIIDCLLNLDNS
jgi:hypothetical protein